MPHSLSKSARHLGRLLAGKPVAERVDMSGRNVIVTGASPNSIGFEAARILAGWGASVVATSRRNAASTARSLKAAVREAGGDGDTIAVRPLDLGDAGSVAGFAAWYRNEFGGKLDVLVNNAGVHRNIFRPRERPPPTADGYEIHWRTNYLGTFHLTSLLLPLLKRSGRESGDARVVNTVSHLYDKGTNAGLFDDGGRYHAWIAYGLSKLALVHFSFEIERRFAESCNLRSIAVHPGSVDTNLTRAAVPKGAMGGVPHRIAAALGSLVLLRPEQGAQGLVMGASAASLQGGCLYDRCAVAETNAESRDEAVSQRLWEQSEAWVRTLALPGGKRHEDI